jgi:putative SOS response-associated peptidase YedK
VASILQNDESHALAWVKVKLTQEQEFVIGLLHPARRAVPHTLALSTLRKVRHEVETVDTAPGYREAFKETLASIPVDGFYEWKKVVGRRARSG